MSEKSLLSIYLAVAHLHLSPLFEEKLMTLWLGANSKHRTCWNWKFLSVKIRMQRVEQELNVQRTRIFWIELLDAAANHRWQQLTSRQKWCRVHLTFSSTAPEWVCIDLSLPSAGLNCISGVHWHCSCSAECMCIFIFIRSSSCIKAEGTVDCAEYSGNLIFEMLEAEQETDRQWIHQPSSVLIESWNRHFHQFLSPAPALQCPRPLPAGNREWLLDPLIDYNLHFGRAGLGRDQTNLHHNIKPLAAWLDNIYLPFLDGVIRTRITLFTKEREESGFSISRLKSFKRRFTKTLHTFTVTEEAPTRASGWERQLAHSHLRHY